MMGVMPQSHLPSTAEAAGAAIEISITAERINAIIFFTKINLSWFFLYITIDVSNIQYRNTVYL